jgi:hypothetical protein
MGISDILFEARTEIEEYEKGKSHADLMPVLDNVKSVMQALQIFLDLPPCTGATKEELRCIAKAERLLDALRYLDTAKIKAAIDFVPE